MLLIAIDIASVELQVFLMGEGGFGGCVVFFF